VSIRVALRHQTNYKYDRFITLSPHIFRLRPAPHCRTPIESYSFRLQPETNFTNWQQDPFGNYQARVVFPEKTNELRLDVEVIADLTVINPFDFFLEEAAEHFPFQYDAALLQQLGPYLERSESGPLLTKWLTGVSRSNLPTVDFLVGLNQRLQRDIAYAIRFEPGVQSCEETIEKALGSCRDTGWLFVQILRNLGLAARFVSGYLVQLTPDEKSLDGPAGPAHDFTDLHAWTEVYIPGAGWVGLDPTSGLFAGEGHIPLACTPTPVDAAPITGLTEMAEVVFSYENTVTRVHEDPRVTKPYTRDQWSAIERLAVQVDGDLDKGDVRLTMGGEPTFVSIDNPDAAEWNISADGPEKRKQATELIGRLRGEFGPGGILIYGQGKQYPGEPLPRWQYGSYWRKDGVPIWHNDQLLAHPDTQGEQTDGRQLLLEIALRLGVQPEYIRTGYEDVVYNLWEENKLPLEVDPTQIDLKSASSRQFLARSLARGLDKPAGYVLPIQWNMAHSGWQSSPWSFRSEHMFLIPGDSAMGFRLPLSSIVKKEPETWPERSLFEPVFPLPNYAQTILTRLDLAAPPLAPPTDTTIRTALCTEVRNGHIHVFLPPLAHLEHSLDLLAAVESAAHACGTPVVIEGYDPPRDNRLERIMVTPDPGILEVNIHPAHNWTELAHNTSTLFEEARQSRLTAEKFMLDGRHTGTGGGNHITLGGKTPDDSPMLRRPDLLRSLVTFWQHHPGLSYLFSGMFIGPTSQAPRVDEGREETLYELEVAFQQMSESQAQSPWVIDRLLRNLLVDMTGNTHRAEFCIDKLYSPDSASGRLGIVELRAFEMPPHPQMSLVQALLVRTLVAKFWNQPYSGDLVRWGTTLHDRFMLPHFVRADLKDVVDGLKDAGYPFQLEWLDPFFEFRFPLYGTLNLHDIQIDLRQAIEPWHVLGEEVTRAGTARFVDSSVERLQIRISGLTESRYVVTCNGRRLPLQSTGTHGEYVAGVRYRAWQPPSGLHPTIGVHSPLIFDLIDTWNQKSVGGCTYHVTHPGGRSYETLPINAYEAEARRVTRFQDEGHTAGTLQPLPFRPTGGQFTPVGHAVGPMQAPEEEPDPEYPHTLDLRKKPLH
jgi:uncharacterized protein (DUF2126 family)/transglutaminase-like putative cysteine protease